MSNLFEPFADVGNYCWLFKAGAIVNFAFFGISVLMILYKIFTFKSKTRASLLYYNVLSAVSFLFSYLLWRVLYSMCVSSGSSKVSGGATIGGISGSGGY